MICNQTNCERLAAFRFTWPGRDEDGICAQCAPKLRGVANAMGMHLQLIPIEPAEEAAQPKDDECDT